MKRSKTIAIVVVNLVLCLLVVEGVASLALRSLNGGWIGKGAFVDRVAEAAGDAGRAESEELEASYDAPPWILHPFVGFARNPEAAAHKLNDRIVDLPVNAHGFFGPSPLTSTSDESFVVLLIGGSVAAELFLDARQVLSDRLAALPEAQGKSVVVVSAALGGMKQPQQLMALSYFLSLGADYDLVINLDGFNEVVLPLVENHQLGVYPFFPRNWIAYAATSVDLGVAALYGRTAELRTRLAERARTLPRSWLARSYAGLVWWQLRQRRLETELFELDGELRDRMNEGELTPQQRGPVYPKRGPAKMRRDLVANWSRSSVQMWALCRALGIDYYHFLQPNQYVAGSKPLSEWELEFAYNLQASYTPKAIEGYPLLIQAGTELAATGHPFFDLTGVYSGVSESLYKDNCCHVNQRGYEILAGAIANAVLRSVAR